MKTTEIEINVTYKQEGTFTFTFTTGDDLEDALLTFINDEAGFNNSDDFEEVTDLSDITYEVIDWGEVEDYGNLQDIDVLNEIAYESDLEDYDWDVISAGIEAGIDIDNIAEAYAGEFKDDEDFAYDMAEQIGAIDKKATWLHTCIDWERAARELMYDYSEANGHYFRNF